VSAVVNGPWPGDQPRGRRVWTEAEVRALGVTTTLTTAASVLQIGRTKAYELARAREFPVPVIEAGSRFVVPVKPLLAALRLDAEARPNSDGTEGVAA